MNIYFKDFPNTKGESAHSKVSLLNSFGLGCTLIKNSGRVHLIVTPDDFKGVKAIQKTVRAVLAQKKKLGEEYRPKNMTQFQNLHKL